MQEAEAARLLAQKEAEEADAARLKAEKEEQERIIAEKELADAIARK